LTDLPSLTPGYIQRLKAEYARLSRMTVYQRINERAADIKADKWLAYTPLSKRKLYDTQSENEYFTVIGTTAAGELAHMRSSAGGFGLYKHFALLKRPTEIRAVLHARGLLTLDSDFAVIRKEPGACWRYCIVCGTQHRLRDFVQSKRYLNHYSYACKKALEAVRNTPWKISA
jgi:hypothetical protein